MLNDSGDRWDGSNQPIRQPDGNVDGITANLGRPAHKKCHAAGRMLAF